MRGGRRDGATIITWGGGSAASSAASRARRLLQKVTSSPALGGNIAPSLSTLSMGRKPSGSASDEVTRPATTVNHHQTLLLRFRCS